MDSPRRRYSECEPHIIEFSLAPRRGERAGERGPKLDQGPPIHTLSPFQGERERLNKAPELKIPPYLLPAAPRHAVSLAARLRREHAREIRETAGVGPQAALLASLAGSLEAYAYVPRSCDEPLFMMGVGPPSPITRSAMVWLLGSKGMDGRPRGVLRAARWGLGRAFAITGAESIEQFIPAWYATGLRFAARLGFAPQPVAPQGGGTGVVHIALARVRFMAVIASGKAETWEP